MTQDPIVEEVRTVREAILKKYDYDLDVIYHHLKELEKKSGHKIVSLSSKRNKASEMAAK